MHCQHCGSILYENGKFCKGCGSAQYPPKAAMKQNQKTGSVGFSAQINDPAFAKYMHASNSWSAVFSFILAAAAILGFFIYGETSSEMDNPQALYIGIGIGGMFVLIALFQIIGRSRTKTWDGIVVDKRIERKRRRRYTGNDDYYWEDYTEYTVYYRSDSGKTFKTSADDDDTVYNYFSVGDRVRHHKGLNSYEKYDKSNDSIIFCNACASLNNIEDDYCFRCKCPLLK